MRPLGPLLLLLLLCSFACGQTCTSYVVVAAIDHTTGEEISNLKPTDLFASSGSTPVPIVSLQSQFNNRVLVLLEADGAADNDKLADITDAITDLARKAPEGKPLEFGIYSDRAIFSGSFNPDPKQRTTEINDVIELGGSLGKHVGLFDALHEALARFGPHRPGDTILLVADPFDDRSHHSQSSVEKELLASGTRLAVMLRQPLSRVSRDFMWSTHRAEKAFFEDLTAKTGGMYVEYRPHLFRFPWKGYMAGVKLPEDAHLHKWKLRFSQQAAGENSRTTLFYPQQLTPCGEPSGRAKQDMAEPGKIPANSIRPH